MLLTGYLHRLRSQLTDPLLIEAEQEDDKSVSAQFLKSGHGQALLYGRPGVN